MLELPLAGRMAPAEESLSDVAYRVIADRLIMLDIRPNEAIDETQLSAEMQMGRTPIREALRHLEGDGLAISYPRKGTYAAPVDYADLDEIAQLRQALEPVAAGLAARMVRGEAAAGRTSTRATSPTLARSSSPRYSLPAAFPPLGSSSPGDAGR
jgi:DNA-binding GntR family transcriptional regulator